MSDLSGNSKATPKQDFQPGAPYKRGDFIGQKYEVYGVLGKGGCGVVYLVYSHDLQGVYALKTFKDEYLADQEVRQRFHKEASVWVELGRHPYLVHAYFVDAISGRLYIEMEYIAPNEEGLNSLEDYLQRQPPSLVQSLRWAVQICHGMEYAYSKGVRAHRDLKPANVMIAQDKTAKITDFGLAGVLSESPAMSAAGLSAQAGVSGLPGQTMLGKGFGTPTHMAPEQFDNAAGCDERSDIYSFGIVLYQMASGGRLPFPVPMGADWQEETRQLHRKSPVPRLDSPLFPIIQRCLEKPPEKRYQTFKEVRTNLEPLLLQQTGEVITPPQLKELEAWEWSNKGVSLDSLGRPDEAIRCFDKALELDPRDVYVWTGKGTSLNSLGRHEDAIRCFDKALELDPHYANAWNNKGTSLHDLARDEDAIRCYDKALELDPREVTFWTNKGTSLSNLGRHEEAIRCYEQALELDPHYAAAWNNKGACLNSLGRYEEEIYCYDKALELDPSYATAWNNKGRSLFSLGRHEDAIRCFDKALELDSRDAYAEAIWANKGRSLSNLERDEEAIHCYEEALRLDPNNVYAWTNKGDSLDSVGRFEEAIRCCDKALELDPRYADAWYNKGRSLFSLGRYEETVCCHDKALELDPRHAHAWYSKGIGLHNLGRHEDAIRCYDKALELDPHDVYAWYNKARAEDKVGHSGEAVRSYQQFLKLAPVQYAKQIEYAGKRLRELGG